MTGTAKGSFQEASDPSLVPSPDPLVKRRQDGGGCIVGNVVGIREIVLRATAIEQDIRSGLLPVRHASSQIW
jgi:hypothetical protein